MIILLMLMLTTAAAAQPLPQEKRGSCPAGYVTSGGYCTPMATTRRDAIPKAGQCPAGWVTSGNYCLGPDKRR
jgi:hypothetical protein